jgi:hypothetical protein
MTELGEFLEDLKADSIALAPVESRVVTMALLGAAIEERAVEAFGKLAGLRLELSDDASDFDLVYISRKLVICSRCIEVLGDISLGLIKDLLQVTLILRKEQERLDSIKREVTGSFSYIQAPRGEKAAILAAQQEECHTREKEWMTRRILVLEVKEAVAERAQTMKRLDSDLRLHGRLYEARLVSGASNL